MVYTIHMDEKLFLEYFNPLSSKKKRISFIELDANIRTRQAIRNICKIVNTRELDPERYVRAQFEFVKGNITLLSFLGKMALERYHKCVPKQYEDQTDFQHIIKDVKYSRIRLDNLQNNDIILTEAISRLQKRSLVDPYTLCLFGIFTSESIRKEWNNSPTLQQIVRSIIYG